jgi:hypothetical protein
MRLPPRRPEILFPPNAFPLQLRGSRGQNVVLHDVVEETALRGPLNEEVLAPRHRGVECR